MGIEKEIRSGIWKFFEGKVSEIEPYSSPNYDADEVDFGVDWKYMVGDRYTDLRSLSPCKKLKRSYFKIFDRKEDIKRIEEQIVDLIEKYFKDYKPENRHIGEVDVFDNKYRVSIDKVSKKQFTLGLIAGEAFAIVKSMKDSKVSAPEKRLSNNIFGSAHGIQYKFKLIYEKV